MIEKGRHQEGLLAARLINKDGGDSEGAGISGGEVLKGSEPDMGRRAIEEECTDMFHIRTSNIWYLPKNDSSLAKTCSHGVYQSPHHLIQNM